MCGQLQLIACLESKWSRNRIGFVMSRITYVDMNRFKNYTNRSYSHPLEGIELYPQEERPLDVNGIRWLTSPNIFLTMCSPVSSTFSLEVSRLMISLMSNVLMSFTKSKNNLCDEILQEWYIIEIMQDGVTIVSEGCLLVYSLAVCAKRAPRGSAKTASCLLKSSCLSLRSCSGWNKNVCFRGFIWS